MRFPTPDNRFRVVVREGLIAFGMLISCGMQITAQKPASPDIVRTTLKNGLRVVIVRNTLAPVVTVEENYLVGANESPDAFPGMAHAQEHMAYRGCDEISGDQISAMYAQLGGESNADTQQTVTQYFATVPAEDVGIALRIDAACMSDITNDQREWDQERGAIEQEVESDLSHPTYRFLTLLNREIFEGTPYAHDALGTKTSFDATTAPMLRKFSADWYAPNNAVLVVVGDIDPRSILDQISAYYGSIPRHPIPQRNPIQLKPVKSQSFTLNSNLPNTLAFVAFRLPGTQSPDYAAVRLLADVLASPRGDLFRLASEGKALETDFGLAETYPLASVAFAVATVPGSENGTSIVSDMKKILDAYVKNGIPADLIEVARRREIAAAEYEKNSIPGLAELWSMALAAEGRNSPEDDLNAIRAVKISDVNRVARRYLLPENSVTGILKSNPSGEPVSEKGFGGEEKITSNPSMPVELPEWAKQQLSKLERPHAGPLPTEERLPNGLRLIVKTIRTSPTVTLHGSVRHDPDLQTPPEKEGMTDILDELFSYGTANLDRIQFQEALDEIAADETAGYNFSLRVPKENFSHGVELLASNELHPRLPADAFEIVKRASAEFVRGNLTSPEYNASRVLSERLLPPGDPVLREVTPRSISKITLSDLKDFYEKTVRPDLTTIVVTGDITPELAKSAIGKFFGPWKSAGPTPNLQLPEVPPNKPTASRVPDPEELQDTVMLAETVGMNRYSPDYYAIQLGSHVLGGGFYATRLYHDLRQLTGYVYFVDLRFDAYQTRATFSVNFASDPANLSRAAALIRRDLSDMQSASISLEELNQAKGLILRQISLRESSQDSSASGILTRAQLDLPIDEPYRSSLRYFELTADEVREAFRKWIRPDSFVRVVRGPQQN